MHWAMFYIFISPLHSFLLSNTFPRGSGKIDVGTEFDMFICNGLINKLERRMQYCASVACKGECIWMHILQKNDAYSVLASYRERKVVLYILRCAFINNV